MAKLVSRAAPVAGTATDSKFSKVKLAIVDRLKWIGGSKIRIGIFVVIIAALVFAGIKLLGNKSDSVQYQTATAAKGTIVSTVETSGTVMVSSIVDISTNASGVVKKVYVKDGDVVAAGQKIAEITLDTAGEKARAQAWASYLSAKNALDSANANYYTQQASAFSANSKFINDAVARDLATDDPTYIQEYATWKAAEAAFNNQAGQVKQAQASLSSAWLSYQAASSMVTSPMLGTVSNVSLVEGMVLSSSTSTTTVSNQRVAVIDNGSNPILSFSLTEVDVAKVKVGQKATITLDSLTDKTFTGVVKTVDRIGSVASGVTSYPIVIQLDTDADAILPNMSANASVIIETKTDVLMIPTSAVETRNGESYVNVMKDGKVAETLVETGISSDSEIEIVSGLNEGDEVVTATIIGSTSAGSKSGTTSAFGGTSSFGSVRVMSGSSGGTAR